MKKTLILLIILLCFLITGCFVSQNGNFKQVDIPDIGSLVMPNNWELKCENESICFVSDKSNYSMIGFVHDIGNGNGYKHPRLSNFEKGELISSEVYSNSVILSENKCTINEKPSTKRFISCYISSKQRLTFVVLDDSIEYDILEKIAKSFKRLKST